MHGLSAGVNGFLLPKKALGLSAREAGRALGVVGAGLEVTLGFAIGLNAFAAGFGRKSGALTLNLLAEVAEVGVRSALDVCDSDIEGGLAMGLTVGFLGIVCIGIGLGTDTGIPALCCRWLSSRRWLSKPWPDLGEVRGIMFVCCCLSLDAACGPCGA